MSSLIEQSLTRGQNKELKRLKKSRSRRLLKIFLFSALVILIIYHFKHRVIDAGAVSIDILTARKDLIGGRADWAEKLSSEQKTMEDWLVRRGTSIELFLFDKISAYTFVSASKSLPLNLAESDLGIFENFYLAVHSGLLRVSFIFIACFRLWLLVLAYALYKGSRAKKVYDGPDMLGQTGNSRPFYSGIRAGLENINEEGAPNKQVRGLACPKMATEAELRSSDLYKILKKYDVVNETNSTLAAIILKYDLLPAYVVPQEENELLREFTLSANLVKNTATILEQILDLHSYYSHGASDQEFETYLEDFSAYNNGKKLSSTEYSKYLQKSLHRTLTREMKEVLANIPLSHICTMVLGLEAGKVLVYAFEGERWQRKSNYPQLCARAVLHSVESFAKEYNFNQRTIIRQAIIYGSRTGDFGPVKLPVDLSDETRALRQWSEVLLAAPHDVNNTANEVEMYGLVCEAHKKFKLALFDKIMIGDKETLNGTYATVANLFMLPFNTVYKLTKQSVTARSLRRLDELAKLESQRQKLRVVHNDGLVDAADKNVIPAHAKIFEPLKDKELKLLSDTYKIPVQSLKEWSSLRIILNNFGWLARRVGDFSVPESSLIFAVMRTESTGPEVNELGLIGKPAMVPLRATQLEERWGKTWQSRTTQVLTASMAENEEDFEKLMRGEEHKKFDESAIANI